MATYATHCMSYRNCNHINSITANFLLIFADARAGSSDLLVKKMSSKLHLTTAYNKLLSLNTCVSLMLIF